MIWIIVFGNPADGFDHYGPFSDGNEATEWASKQSLDDRDWWTIELSPPERLGK